MVKRSLQASYVGIQQAKRAFALKGWTQENLAGEVNLKTRQPIWRFFTGQPVDRQIFMEICSILDLEWREIADAPPAEFPEPGHASVALAMKSAVNAVNPVYPAVNLEFEPCGLNLEVLVQQVRSQHYEVIQNQCGILQLLDISHPVNLDDIYVDVNVLEGIASQQQLEISNLQNLEPTEFDRVGLRSVVQSYTSGIKAIETYSKLRVLGKPGVGKTMFLQHIALQCSRGTFAADQIPVFISLKEFAEDSRHHDECSLFDYVGQVLHTSGVSNSALLSSLLKAGRVLLLLDGMDEVLNQDTTAVLREIRKFSDKYPHNRFIVSCRTAALKFQLRGFTDVEIAPFTQIQITRFSQKWFSTLSKVTARSGQNQSEQFIQKLDLPENWQLRELVATPIFLHLACWVFQGHGNFSTKQTEFYKQGLDLLLGKWDEARGVERDDIYKGFLLPQKLKLFSYLAEVTFEQGQYFFEKRAIEQHIGDYLRSLPDTTLDSEEIQLESETILKAIEAQHGILIERARGIFSFSHLVFQEYLTARKIVACHNSQELEQSLGRLVRHVTDPHWREVFLFTISMLRSPDFLVKLMKQKIDSLVSQDPYLQDFLSWSSQKSQPFQDNNRFATTRACYLALSKFSTYTGDVTSTTGINQELIIDQVFSSDQKQLLKSYYLGYELLIDCLDSDCGITTEIRQDIEATLLLPKLLPQKSSAIEIHQHAGEF